MVIQTVHLSKLRHFNPNIPDTCKKCNTYKGYFFVSLYEDMSLDNLVMEEAAGPV